MQPKTDAYRPGWHFAAPGVNAMPADPNGAFFADGTYHLMFLYHNDETNAYHWGHLTSTDLLHWQRHADALTTENGDMGAYSGGAFLDDDGTAYLTYWKFPSEDGCDRGGIAIAKATAPYEHWERQVPLVVESDENAWGVTTVMHNGQKRFVGSADPGNIWREGDYYYLQTGNLLVLNAYGRAEDSDLQYVGDFTDLFRSTDLREWSYLHRFYEHNARLDSMPDRTEDDMCPQFLPLSDENGTPTGKYLQTFISHNHGAQYYIGRWDTKQEVFVPEKHGRFSWNDRTCFAPEALCDAQNRQIIWFWLLDNLKDDYQRFGWSGVYSFPRKLWLQNGILHMSPVEELTELQEASEKTTVQTENAMQSVANQNGVSFRLQATLSGNAEQIGFALRMNETERTEVYYDRTKQCLVMDCRQCGADDFQIAEEAPIAVPEGEILSFDILVDRAIVEVYLNTEQAIARRVYPKNPETAIQVAAFARGGAVTGTVETFSVSDTV